MTGLLLSRFATLSKKTEIFYVGRTTIVIPGRTTSGSFNIDPLVVQNSPLAPGDLMVSVYCVSTFDRNPTLSVTGNSSGAFTNRTNIITSHSGREIKMSSFWQFMPSTVDTTLTFSATGNLNDAGLIVNRVYRGVNQTTPFDVADTTSSAVNTGNPNPASITPSTPGSWIVIVGAAGHNTTSPADFTSSDLDTFTNNFQADTNDCQAGHGHKTDWTSGAFDAAQFGGGVGSNTAASCAAISMVLRPA
jgi:hypothetical protein